MRFRYEIQEYRQRDRKMAYLILICVIALALVSLGADNPPKGHLVTETYIVSDQDTGLDAIAYKFMAKSSVKRDVREFRSGIIEQNWDAVFQYRYPSIAIYPGDRLQVSYWVNE